MEKIMKEIRESCGLMYEVDDDNVEDQANSDTDTSEKQISDDVDNNQTDLVQKDEELSVSEQFQSAMSEYINNFEEHFAQYFNMKETVWVNHDNGSMIVFPIDRMKRFEIIIIFNMDKSQEDMIKMISCVYKNKRRRVIDKRDFNIKEMQNNISTPESLFPTRKVENLLGQKLIVKEKKTDS